MARLSKAQAAKHAEACALLEKEALSQDDKYFVLEHWREDAAHLNSLAGAFFTPQPLARDFALEVTGPRVIDLCAGIGSLAFAAWHHFDRHREALSHITCVDNNPDYIAVGKKILPEASWVLADIFALPKDIGYFDCAISNPPFGTVRATEKAPRFHRNNFEYSVIDVASDLADYGVFLIPQVSAPFEFSGKPCYRENLHDKYQNFVEQTSITLEAGCGMDTSVHGGCWNIKAPPVEIVVADFHEARLHRLSSCAQPDLFQNISAIS